MRKFFIEVFEIVYITILPATLAYLILTHLELL